MTLQTQRINAKIALKAKIKAVSKRLYCYYGNILRHDHYHNLLNNDWAFVVVSTDKDW